MARCKLSAGLGLPLLDTAYALHRNPAPSSNSVVSHNGAEAGEVLRGLLSLLLSSPSDAAAIPSVRTVVSALQTLSTAPALLTSPEAVTSPSNTDAAGQTAPAEDGGGDVSLRVDASAVAAEDTVAVPQSTNDLLLWHWLTLADTSISPIGGPCARRFLVV